MLLMLGAVFFGALVTMQVTGTIEEGVAENVQAAVDLENTIEAFGGATTFSLTSILIVVIFAVCAISCTLAALGGVPSEKKSD
jgi:hypothetical protein